MAKFYYDKSKNLLKKRFEDVQHIALTTDCWTSCQNYSFVGITAHYLKPNFKIVSFNLAIRHLIGGHAADNLAKYIRSIISEFKISSKVSFVVTDNAPNIINAVQELGYKSQRCFAHILNLIIVSTFTSIKETIKNRKQTFQLVDYDFSSCNDDTIDIKKALDAKNSNLKKLLVDNADLLESFEIGK